MFASLSTNTRTTFAIAHRLSTIRRADLILVGDRLEGLWLARSVAQQVRRRVRQNLAWAALYNLSVLPLAMAGWLPPWLAAAGRRSRLLGVMTMRGRSGWLSACRRNMWKYCAGVVG